MIERAIFCIMIFSNTGTKLDDKRRSFVRGTHKAYFALYPHGEKLPEGPYPSHK